METKSDVPPSQEDGKGNDMYLVVAWADKHAYELLKHVRLRSLQVFKGELVDEHVDDELEG